MKNRIYSLIFLTVVSVTYGSVRLAAQELQSLLGEISAPQAYAESDSDLCWN